MTADPARLRRDADWIQRLGDKGHLDIESTEPMVAALRRLAGWLEVLEAHPDRSLVLWGPDQISGPDSYSAEWRDARTAEFVFGGACGHSRAAALDALAAALGYDDARS